MKSKPNHQSQRNHYTSAFGFVPLFALILTQFSVDSPAQDAIAAAPQVEKATIIANGPHDRIWQTPTGGTYTEVATGLNFWDGTQWAESQTVINIVNGYGVSDKAQHKTIFSPSINAIPAIDMSFDDMRFQSHIMGLVYYDYASGKSILFCETKDSVGQVQGNTVIYPDVFTDAIKCDVRYSVKIGSFEQDVIVRAQLPSPAEVGNLNPATTRLQVWTEFYDPPVPAKQTSFLYQEMDQAVRQTLFDPDFKDEFLSFGQQLQIGRGKALAIETDAIREAGINMDEEIFVGKEFCTIEGRNFLIESVELTAIQPLLNTLPTAAIQKQQDPNSQLAGLRKRGGLTRSEFVASLPKRQKKRLAKGKLQMAQAKPLNGPALWIDYITTITTTNYTFKGDTTYYAASSISLSGTNTCEGGTVIKFATNSTQISITGGGAVLNMLTSPYRCAVFTAKDDNSCGETITGSTGNPANKWYANYALYYDASAATNTASNLRISYATNGVFFHGIPGFVSHCQFVHCKTAIGAYSRGFNARNCLIYDAATAFNLTFECDGSGENITVDKAVNLSSLAALCTLSLTNSLLVNVTTNGTYSGANNASNTTSANVFLTVGEASHYLTNNSPYLNLGTTNINSTLLSDLKLRTTFPPVLLTNAITVDTVLSPQAQRDTDIPDLGFHYDCLDFIVNALVVTNANLTLSNSVAVAYYGSTGIKLQTGSKLNSLGSPLNHNRLTRFESVQEQANTNWAGGSNWTIFQDDLVSGTMPEARLRFTELGLLASGGSQFSGGGKMGLLALTDCRVLGGAILWNVNGTNTRALTLTNTLFDRTTNSFGTKADAVTIHARNNLFKNGYLTLSPTNSNNWTWYDNAFDGVTLTNTSSMTNGNNAYIYAANALNRLTTNGGGDQILTNGWTYQTGALGIYYQPTNSALIDAGSRNATNSGLYHFCTTTNEVKETNSIVDIGLHYVAVDANGNPSDFDGDLLPDYLEDLNGNGVWDTGETNWKASNSGNAVGNDYLALLEGRNPFVTNSVADTGNLINFRLYTPLK